MSIEFRLLDHFKLTNRLSINFACSYSEDDRLFIISDSGIYIITLKGYITCPFPDFSCKKDFLQVSNFTPSANVDLDINSFHRDLDRNALYETVLSTEYSGNLNNTTPIEAIPLCAEWSPKGIVGTAECMLAILTNLYSLEIYVRYLDENDLVEYLLISNISQEIINIQKSQWKYADRFATHLKLTEMKTRVNTVTATAFTWSHLFKINNKECCAIFVGHMNGDISTWKINFRDSNSKEQSKLHFLGRYSTQLKRITTLHWHQTREFAGGLSFADSEGKMSILNITNLHQEAVTMDKELGFWTEPDKILVDKITVMIYENRTYILVIKQSYLIIYGISQMGDVFDQKVCQVDNYYITGIHHFKNIILILTLPGVLKQFTLVVVKERISLMEKNIPLKIDMSKYRTHGFFFSKNMVLIGLLAHPCQLRNFSKTKAFVNVFLFNNSLLNPFEILWYNSTGSLRDYWDCFEALRLICLKDKRFPWLGLSPDLNYDKLSLLQLKTLRLLAKQSEMVFNSVPFVRNYNIKPYILLHYLVEIKLIVRRINKLLNLRNSGKDLSVFQMRSIDLQNFFLKEMVVKNILAKANIIGSLCLPPHADNRCAISMMPIFLEPAYKCPFCKVLAHKEIEKEEDAIYCPYCDIPMEKRYVYEETCTDSITSNVIKDYETNSEELKSICFEDCLKEDISFSDIEENSSDFIIFSDSEDESTEEENMLRTLYVRLDKVSLEEVVKLDDEGIDNDPSIPGPSKKVLKLEQNN
ncbi:hypothetical protein NQ314_017361 [Rhamnusium bicolor]|uniref:Transcription factor IIIC 90kDa subunit N-terminal domain-containing protein n=1 Tax=Rhamnusium bicolor TaxID=1586634 RepID=A0AAV8WTV4_9CUCU|nr:hypothetical protein NQ314_017361 [Rhamnusium bicolor]